ncbi:hypothetical protein ACLOJK_039199 [Asimina triloba]
MSGLAIGMPGMRGRTSSSVLREDGLPFFNLRAEKGTYDLFEGHCEREREGTKIMLSTVETMSFLQTTPNDDDAKRSAANVVPSHVSQIRSRVAEKERRANGDGVRLHQVETD